LNFGVGNAFPLPALDGEQLDFVLLEGVSGRRVNQLTQEAITSVTLLFLLYIGHWRSRSKIGIYLCHSWR